MLFADLKGSMELLAGRDPEEARKILDPALDNDGSRTRVRGYGEPGDGRRHHGAVRRAGGSRGPRRARLSRRPPLQEALARYAAGSYAAPMAWRCKLGVGLNSGGCSSAGDRQRFANGLHRRGPDYAPGGSDGAARPLPGTILVAWPPRCSSRRATSQVTSRGPVAVQGPVRARSRSTRSSGAGAVALAAARGGRPGAHALRRSRRRRSTQLRQALERAQAGAGQVVAVVGEPGVGKSRLVLGVHPLPSRAGLADPRRRLRLLRPGRPAYLPGHRPAQGLLPDRGARRQRGRFARR